MPKYDTNPLDPEFPAKAAAGEATQALPYKEPRTKQFRPPVQTEEQTRRFDEGVNFASPYDGRYIPAEYRQATQFEADNSSTRKVERIGLPENILTAVPYIPWYLGMVAGLLILFLVPKSEAKVRFHAAQGLAAHIGILIVTTILGMIGKATDIADAGNAIFQIVTSIMLIVFAYKAWKGRPVHIESVDSLTEWLEEKIKPSASV